jgi:hypothetical protein
MVQAEMPLSFYVPQSYLGRLTRISSFPAASADIPG